jgi:hypothetical protein
MMRIFNQRHELLCLTAFSTKGLVDAAGSAPPFPMTWSSQAFGPDGPWHAVEVAIGSNNDVVSLYPGGILTSHIFGPGVCQNVSLGTTCYASKAGLYNYTSSVTADRTSVSSAIMVGADFTGGALQIGGSDARIVLDDWNIGNHMETIPDFDQAVFDSIWGTLPDGTTYPLSVGSMALGAPNAVNQSFSNSPRPPVNATLLAGWLTTTGVPSNKIEASNSYGMHIG